MTTHTNAINNTSYTLNMPGASSGVVTIQPQPAAGTYNFNLPTTAGTSGQILTSGGGAGSPMTWTSGSGGAFTSINVQTFTTSGTYTPTASMVQCVIEVCGGGGGGGGYNSSLTSFSAGGGGGGYSKGVFSSSDIGASQSVTVGAAGSGGNGSSDGGTGGTTSVGSLISATGGSGGQSSNNGAQGGAPGTGTGGYLNVGGSYGSNPTYFNASNPGVGYSAGYGGASIFGGSPRGVYSNGLTPVNGFDAVAYGAGGSGCALTGTGTATGGSGAAGIVIITEYIA